MGLPGIRTGENRVVPHPHFTLVPCILDFVTCVFCLVGFVCSFYITTPFNLLYHVNNTFLSCMLKIPARECLLLFSYETCFIDPRRAHAGGLQLPLSPAHNCSQCARWEFHPVFREWAAHYTVTMVEVGGPIHTLKSNFTGWLYLFSDMLRFLFL